MLPSGSAARAMKPPQGCRVGAIVKRTPVDESRSNSAFKSSTARPTPVCRPTRLSYPAPATARPSRTGPADSDA